VSRIFYPADHGLRSNNTYASWDSVAFSRRLALSTVMPLPVPGQEAWRRSSSMPRYTLGTPNVRTYPVKQIAVAIDCAIRHVSRTWDRVHAL